MLGAKWLEAVPLIPWLGVFGATYGVAHSLDAYMLATGRERLTALLTLGERAAHGARCCWFAGQRFGIEGVAAAKAAMAIVFVLTLAVGCTRRSPFDSESGLALRVAAAGGLQRDDGVRSRALQARRRSLRPVATGCCGMSRSAPSSILQRRCAVVAARTTRRCRAGCAASRRAAVAPLQIVAPG